MPRPKGSKNARTLDAVAFVNRVEKRISELGSPFGLESKAAELLTCDDPKVICVVWKTLMEYKFGKPTQTLQLNGDTKPIPIGIDFEREANAEEVVQ